MWYIVEYKTKKNMKWRFDCATGSEELANERVAEIEALGYKVLLTIQPL